MPLYTWEKSTNPHRTRYNKGFFTTSWEGLPRLRKMLRGARQGIKVGLSKTLLEQWFLQKTIERFDPRGKNPNAQRGPDGKFWAAPAASTLKRRKQNTTGVTQALVDTGKLRNSIDIVKKLPGFVRINGGIGTFEIGVRSSPKKYAGVLQYGGVTPKGGVIPPRPFIGVSKKDERELGLSIERNIRKRI